MPLPDGTAHPRSSPTLNTAAGSDAADAARRAQEMANTAKRRLAIGVERIERTPHDRRVTSERGALERKLIEPWIVRLVSLDQCGRVVFI